MKFLIFIGIQSIFFLYSCFPNLKVENFDASQNEIVVELNGVSMEIRSMKLMSGDTMLIYLKIENKSIFDIGINLNSFDIGITGNTSSLSIGGPDLTLLEESTFTNISHDNHFEWTHKNHIPAKEMNISILYINNVNSIIKELNRKNVHYSIEEYKGENILIFNYFDNPYSEYYTFLEFRVANINYLKDSTEIFLNKEKL